MFEILLLIFITVLFTTLVVIDEKKIHKNKIPFSKNVFKKDMEK